MLQDHLLWCHLTRHEGESYNVLRYNAGIPAGYIKRWEGTSHWIQTSVGSPLKKVLVSGECAQSNSVQVALPSSWCFYLDKWKGCLWKSWLEMQIVNFSCWIFNREFTIIGIIKNNHCHKFLENKLESVTILNSSAGLRRVTDNTKSNHFRRSCHSSSG
jgi:hypothetical protein